MRLRVMGATWPPVNKGSSGGRKRKVGKGGGARRCEGSTDSSMKPNT